MNTTPNQANAMTATASTDNMNQADHITAETLEAILRAPTIEALEDAVQSLPIDVEAFHDRMQAIEATEPRPSPVEAREAIAEALQACALPGCVVNALFASLMTRAIFELGRLRAESPTDRAELLADLREAVADDDEAGLAVALGMSPFSASTYAASLRTLADAMNPDELADPERVQAARVRALRGAATGLLDDELIGAILTALDAWAVLHAETPHQKAIREAFKEARTLMDTLGEDDPRTLDAVIKAVNLKEPGCCSRMLAECGIQMPKPDRCTDDGEPLYSLEAIAAALDADPDDLEEHARELEALGIGGIVRVAGDNTHTLQ